MGNEVHFLLKDAAADKASIDPESICDKIDNFMALSEMIVIHRVRLS